MSIFLPYDTSTVLTYLSELFSIDITSLTSYETLILTIVSNLYFFVFWFFICYFVLKIFNRIYEKFL